MTIPVVTFIIIVLGVIAYFVFRGRRGKEESYQDVDEIVSEVTEKVGEELKGKSSEEKAAAFNEKMKRFKK